MIESCTNRRNPLIALIMAAVVFGGMTWACGARADAAYNWSALEGVRRIAVVSPFFCATTGVKQGKPEDEKFYLERLNRLAAVMKQELPARLGDLSRFRVVPAKDVDSALRGLRWTARDLFANKGETNGKVWPALELGRVRALAKRLKVDAVFVGAMRDPASIGEGLRLHHDSWNPNPLNWGIQRNRAHVLSPRVQAFLITKNGVTAWKDEQMADHPRTKPSTPKTLAIDWIEATQQVAQQLADSLNRLAPPNAKPRTAGKPSDGER